MKQSEPTYEDHAKLMEDVLVAMAASDARMGPDIQAHFAGYRDSLTEIKRQFNRLHINLDDLDHPRVLPQESYAVFGAGSEGSCELVKVRKLGFFESQKLRMLKVATNAPLCSVEARTVLHSGKTSSHDPILFWYGGGDKRWHPLNAGRYSKPSGKTKTKTNFRTGQWRQSEEVVSTVQPYPEMLVSYQYGLRICWHLRISMPESPAILVATDPIGVRELLRMRDVPEGRTRREALRHWVKEHWRQNRKDESIEHRVREHIRGADSCDWFGLWCRILPSATDHEIAQQSKNQGKAWRRNVAYRKSR